jgi:hypothetical protein
MNNRKLINSYHAKVQTSPLAAGSLNANSEYRAIVQVFEYRTTTTHNGHNTTKTSNGKRYIINGKEYGPEFAREIA